MARTALLATSLGCPRRRTVVGPRCCSSAGAAAALGGIDDRRQITQDTGAYCGRRGGPRRSGQVVGQTAHQPAAAHRQRRLAGRSGQAALHRRGRVAVLVELDVSRGITSAREQFDALFDDTFPDPASSARCHRAAIHALLPDPGADSTLADADRAGPRSIFRIWPDFKMTRAHRPLGVDGEGRRRGAQLRRLRRGHRLGRHRLRRRREPPALFVPGHRPTLDDDSVARLHRDFTYLMTPDGTPSDDPDARAAGRARPRNARGRHHRGRDAARAGRGTDRHEPTDDRRSARLGCPYAAARPYPDRASRRGRGSSASRCSTVTARRVRAR